ncbi:ROK family protein [Flavihumibacter profundi]|uniref:ROK family protein n=1 Tax=Flavihumibacter profundi TaxID=2716883 RepID=UPI001CC5EA56|nr:ROK family protein [Flavihumibacter profundi]MBZ5856978.1 ROK family protein [Flavihumibacter profundi]
MSSFAIGIDLGGTRIKSVAIDADGHILHEKYHPTNDGDDLGWKITVASAVKELQSALGTHNLNVGLSAPGLPDNKNTCIACMPGRMQGLENFNWSEFLHQETYVLNDAVAAMICEAKFGAAINKKNVVMLTLGTGVGGAILIDGKPYQGAMNKAGHIGHMVINDEGEPDVTGMPGSLEDCIGNCTISKRSEGKFNSTYELLEAYRNGDGFAKEVWLKSVRQLGVGLASIANILSPELIVLGGGITQAGDALFLPLKHFMKEFEWQPLGKTTEIEKAVFGDMAGAIGAACFAMK